MLDLQIKKCKFYEELSVEVLPFFKNVAITANMAIRPKIFVKLQIWTKSFKSTQTVASSWNALLLPVTEEITVFPPFFSVFSAQSLHTYVYRWAYLFIQQNHKKICSLPEKVCPSVLIPHDSSFVINSTLSSTKNRILVDTPFCMILFMFVHYLNATDII